VLSFQGNDMVRFTHRFLLAGGAILLSLAAQASPHLGVYLKTYYTDFQIVKACVAQSHLKAADAETAKNAISKVEAYYLNKDPSIKKDILLKQAISNTKAAFKMMNTTHKVDIPQYCRSSLDELVDKAHQIESGATTKKSGS
jgi:hypothetical protein